MDTLFLTNDSNSQHGCSLFYLTPPLPNGLWGGKGVIEHRPAKLEVKFRIKMDPPPYIPYLTWDNADNPPIHWLVP